MDYFLATLFLIICVLLIIVVLLQKGRGGGLGAAFGGMGQTAFGTRVGDVFTWVTIVLTALFLLLAIGVQMLFRPPVAKLDPPSLSPAPPGRIGDQNKVTVSAAGGIKTYYTLDGSDPTEKSTEVNGAISVEVGQNLKVKSFRDKAASDTVQGVYGVAPEAVGKAQTAPSSAPTSAPAKKITQTLPATVPAGM